MLMDQSAHSVLCLFGSKPHCQAKLVKYRDEAVEAEELVNRLTQQVKSC